MPAELKMPLAEWQDMRNRVTNLETELAEARKAVDQARLGDDGSDARRLAAAIEHLFTVVQFSIANLDPLTVRGWPHEELRKFASLLPDLPGVSQIAKETSNDLRLFAQRAGEWEHARAEGTEKEKLAAESAGRSASLPDQASFQGSTILDPPR